GFRIAVFGARDRNSGRSPYSIQNPISRGLYFSGRRIDPDAWLRRLLWSPKNAHPLTCLPRPLAPVCSVNSVGGYRIAHLRGCTDFWSEMIAAPSPHESALH